MNDILPRQKPFLSVVIPAYKESKRIGATLLDLKAYLDQKPYEKEVIVVVDGSPDDTRQVVEAQQAHIPYLRVISYKNNRGKGYAVRTGMQAAAGQYRLFMDADNSVRIKEVDAFIGEMQKAGTDIAIGSIAFSYMQTVENAGWHRRFLGSLSKLMVRIIAVPNIYDTQRGFKVFTEKAADAIFKKQTINRFGFDIEILLIGKMHGFKVRELPVDWVNAAGSTVRFSDYGRTFAELGTIFMNKCRGLYNSPYRRRRDEKSTFARFFMEISFLPRRIWREITDSPMHLHIKIIKKGKGLIFHGKEFVHHTGLHHSETALYTIVRAQKLFLGVAGLAFVVCLFIDWHLTLTVAISTITVLYFVDLMYNAYLAVRSIKENPEIKATAQEISAIKDEDLPRYTVFCPLYKEWQVVPQFVKAMTAMDYPVHKLEIIFLLEANDAETIEKIKGQTLPDHFKVIVVPDSKPKTKPKAMNYGLSHVTGEYLVIYDAEDMPEPDQLKKAVIAFSRSDEQTVCIQAKLNFYNVNQNILTRMFTAEYSLWFDLILPGLQSIQAPIPLGGTSNHFKVSALKELQGWDAFNVTEDCDLGMRLAKRGLKTAIMESTTYEEANSDLKNWYNQRSRWIKGYIQTYLVHMRDPKAFKGKAWSLLSFQATVGGKIFSMIVNPVFWLLTICYFAFKAQTGEFIESLFPGIVLHIGVASFIFGNFLYLYNYMIGCAKRRYDHLTKYVFLIPLYWFGMSVASWKAVYEIFVKPHHWSKTVHGLHLTNPNHNPNGKTENVVA